MIGTPVIKELNLKLIVNCKIFRNIFQVHHINILFILFSIIFALVLQNSNIQTKSETPLVIYLYEIGKVNVLTPKTLDMYTWK